MHKAEQQKSRAFAYANGVRPKQQPKWPMATPRRLSIAEIFTVAQI